MNTLRAKRHLGAFAFFILLSAIAVQAGAAASIEEGKFYYGIEINGVLCGYSEIDISSVKENGGEMILLEQKTFAMLSALGSRFNTEIELTYHIDPRTGKFSYHESQVEQGPTKMHSTVSIEGDTAHVTTSQNDREAAVALPRNVILENTLFFPHLTRDFVDEGLDDKTYNIFEVMEEKVQKTTYTKVGTEKLQLSGRSYDALILDRLNQETGLRVKFWLDAKAGHLLKSVLPNNRISYLTDSSVKKRIEMANLDENLIARVDVKIADFRAISYMKVKAAVEPTGLWVTPEDLNVPGQRFTGKVEENLVEGVFEIEHARYDGSNAPPFPADFGWDEALAECLEPEALIESDDPVLAGKAREITAGSKDSWEAARRLSEWVAGNIEYSIPGGSARNTYDTRKGECGAHSLLLAAFCRASGIPARVVWGCMYVPNYGGSFGQHGWNEIYMGEAGWIPVDATSSETDYIDSGHIRIGTYGSRSASALNPIRMEVLDYRVGSEETAREEENAGKMYEAYVGDYTPPVGNDVFKVFVQNGCLNVDIPGKILLPLNDPDEEGRWYCKLSDRLYCEFVTDDSGGEVEMRLHEIIEMPRKSGPEDEDGDVPEEFKPYPGKYLLEALNAEFTVRFEDGSLAVDDPLEKITVGLQHPDAGGRWVDEFDKNAIFFVFDEEGKVESMNIDSINRFNRKGQ